MGRKSSGGQGSCRGIWILLAAAAVVIPEGSEVKLLTRGALVLGQESRALVFGSSGQQVSSRGLCVWPWAQFLALTLAVSLALPTRELPDIQH